MAAEWIAAAAGGLALAAGAGRYVLATSRRHAPEPDQVRYVRIRGRYEPAELHVPAGEPVRLIFRREETAPCSERVVFPDYGLSVTLPAFKDVAVDLPASEPGIHGFTCHMEMLHGRLVVDPLDARRTPEEVAA